MAGLGWHEGTKPSAMPLRISVSLMSSIMLEQQADGAGDSYQIVATPRTGGYLAS